MKQEIAPGNHSRGARRRRPGVDSLQRRQHLIEGRLGLRPTYETWIHLEVYRQRLDVGAVLHAHPPLPPTSRSASFSWQRRWGQ